MAKQLSRAKQFHLTIKKDRNRNIIASPADRTVITTYTVDRTYVATYTLSNGRTRRVLPAGYILSLDPTLITHPNYTTYGHSVVGVLLQDADLEDAETAIVPVLFEGDAIEKFCWDNGEYGKVLQETKQALAHRIRFVPDL